jgi:hypothetical protein
MSDPTVWDTRAARLDDLHVLELGLRDAIVAEARAAARWHNSPIDRQDRAVESLRCIAETGEAKRLYTQAYQDSLRWGDVKCAPLEPRVTKEVETFCYACHNPGGFTHSFPWTSSRD